MTDGGKESLSSDSAQNHFESSSTKLQGYLNPKSSNRNNKNRKIIVLVAILIGLTPMILELSGVFGVFVGTAAVVLAVITLYLQFIINEKHSEIKDAKDSICSKIDSSINVINGEISIAAAAGDIPKMAALHYKKALGERFKVELSDEKILHKQGGLAYIVQSLMIIFLVTFFYIIWSNSAQFQLPSNIVAKVLAGGVVCGLAFLTIFVIIISSSKLLELGNLYYHIVKNIEPSRDVMKDLVNYYKKEIPKDLGLVGKL